MSVAEGILLGIIQGLTEFLPISSSGHLVLFQELLGFKGPALLLDTALHFGTLVSILVFFRSDIRGMFSETWSFSRVMVTGNIHPAEISRYPSATLALWVVIGSIPTALVGLSFKGPIETLFGSTTVVGAALIFTGLAIGTSRLIPPGYGQRTGVGLPGSLLVGLAQGLALVPGISRSGTTIVCGLLLKMDRELAARFSFLLAIPAVIGALGLQIKVGGPGNVPVSVLLSGFLTSTLTGLLALKLLLRIVKKGRLYYFAPYCWALGLAVLLIKHL
ncbi:MAG: undecaprenyl-diphosphate phosphatase [Deltaproteobacteria bacterium]|nr:undecaprenyl-diphosphate phosphatase [Deltaproteobacteria bacterium]